MRIIHTQFLLLLVIGVAWLSQPASSEKSSSSTGMTEVTGRSSKDKDKNDLYPRRFLGGFRPMMRLLGMMGIPLLPLLLIRGLVTGGAGGGAVPNQGLGAGSGLGSLGALGLIGPFGMGGGYGGLRPLGGAGGLRPLRPGGLRPGGLAGLLGGAGGAAGAGAGPAAALFLKKRSAEEPPASSPFSNFLKALVKLEKVFDLYDLTVPDCQRLIVCEVHKKGLNPSVGSFTEKLIQAFGIESRLERSRFRSNTKNVLKDFLKAARIGLQQKSCETVYHKCPAAVSRSSTRKGKV